MTPTNNLKAFPKLYANESDYVHKTFEEYLAAAAENYDKGFEPLQTLPASWYNSLLYLLTEQAQATKVLCDSIFAELQAVLTAGGVEPSAAYTNQLLTAIETITKLNTATASILGGIKSSADNWKIQVDPTTSIASVNTVDASTSTKGIVQLNDNINSDSTTQAATANAVRSALEAAHMYAEEVVPGIATPSTPGLIKSSASPWEVAVDSTTSGRASVNTVAASTSTPGIVQLSDALDSPEQDKAATANAVRQAFAHGVYRAVCSTSPNFSSKYVDLPSNFTLTLNTLISVFFLYENTAATPTLEVGSTGAYPIRYSDENEPAGGKYYAWKTGEVVLFQFDGECWKMLKGSSMTTDGKTLYIEC